MTDIKNLSIFVECSTGSTPTVETLKKYIDIISAFGYNQLYLGVTDAYKIPGEPYFNYNRGGYTKEQFQEIDAYAEAHGIELRVNFQTLAHLNELVRYDCYHEILDRWEGILMVGEEKTYEFVDKMFASLSESVKSRTIHIGLDEAYDLGLGNYLRKYGYRDKKELLLEHLNRVSEIAKKYNYTCEMWADMFFHMVQGSMNNDDGVVPDDVRELMPDNVKLVHWYYDRQTEEVLKRQLNDIKSIADNVVMAGSAYKHVGLAPVNRYSIDVMGRQIQACRELDIDSYMVTLWSDNGAQCSIFAVLPSVFAVSEFAKGKTVEEIDKEKFREIVGLDYEAFMLLDRMNDPFFKDIDTLNFRARWGLMLDLFIPSYDTIITEGNNEAYGRLAEKYAAIDAGKYQPIFNNYINLARVFSIKMELSIKIRKAYKENNLELLKQYAQVDIPQMIAYMEKYTEEFESYWLQENMAYGLEVNHYYDGALIGRWKSVARRLMNFVEQGVRIQELESEVLPPCKFWVTNEDTCIETNYRRVVSYCTL